MSSSADFMRVGFRRESGHGDSGVAIVEPLSSGRGVLLYNSGGQYTARRADVGHKQGSPEMRAYLVSNKFLPRDVPDCEFIYLHDVTKSGPVFSENGGIALEKIPVIKALVDG